MYKNRQKLKEKTVTPCTDALKHPTLKPPITIDNLCRDFAWHCITSQWKHGGGGTGGVGVGVGDREEKLVCLVCFMCRSLFYSHHLSSGVVQVSALREKGNFRTENWTYELAEEHIYVVHKTTLINPKAYCHFYRTSLCCLSLHTLPPHHIR